MSNGKIAVSLDLGYASIGWCVAQENGREPIVKGCGTVVFEPDRCLVSARRGYRRQRRHIRATHTRILRMKAFLVAQGVLTPAIAGLQHPHPEPWRLAAQALRGERELTAAELWAVLLWYAHNRGYDGNRLWSTRSRGEEDKDDIKKVQEAKAQMEAFGTTTMAETVLDIVTEGHPEGPALKDYKALTLAFARSTVMGEIERILRAHIGKLPGLTEAVVHTLMADPVREPDALRTLPGIPQAFLGGILAGQVRPRFDNRIVPLCPISGLKTPLKSCDAFLAFRWAELLCHVRVGFADQPLRPLTPDELKALDDGIRKAGRYTKNDFIKTVRGLVACDHDNLDALLSTPDADEMLIRYPGLAQLDKTYGVANFKQDEETQRILRRMSHALAQGKQVRRADILPLLDKDKSKKASDTLTATLPSGRAPYSERVMRQAVTEIFKGKDPHAEAGALYRDATKEDPLAEADIDRTTNNHLVRHRIKILLRLLHDIVHDYAENNPSRIGHLFVEVARDIKDFSGKKKKEIDSEIASFRRSALQATAAAAKALGCDEAAVSAALARKMRIAADLNFTCPYTGTKFDAWDIRNKVVDLDHILPRSQRATDSMSSLVLTFNAVNRLKGARTARQFIRDCGGQTVQTLGPNGEMRELQIRHESVYLAAIEKLKNPSSVPKEQKLTKSRIAKLKMLTTDEADEMTEGMLTQTSAVNKLAHRAILGWFKACGCKPIRPILIPGRITKEIRTGYDLLGMLAQFDARLTRTYTDMDGNTKTDTVPKGDMRGLTHMHHAVDAIAILLAGTLITPQNRVWDVMFKRRQNDSEKDFLLQNGPFGWDSHDRIYLRNLAPEVMQAIRTALGELRTVRYTSKRLGRTVLEETQWRVERIQDGRVYLRQGRGKAAKREDLALSAVYGLNPPTGDGKLLRNKAVYVGDANYAIALTTPPIVLRERFVWRELQVLAAQNAGKAPKLLRKGDLVVVPDGEHKGVWMVDSLMDKKRGVKINLTVPYNAKSAYDPSCRWHEVTLPTLIASYGKTPEDLGRLFPRYRLTGIPACPITSLKSPGSKKASSTPKTDSSTAE